jgi:histidinol phosphatase-like PHP family hydrolase
VGLIPAGGTQHEKEGTMEMDNGISRRGFLGGAAALCAASVFSGGNEARAEASAPTAPLGFPLVDLHVHLDNSSIEQVLPLSQERGVKFGIVEHAGTKENVYPTVLSNDAELGAYIANLEGKPVYKGVQAEWTDWMGCFSKEALARLDYVLTDTMTVPGKNGKRQKMWEAGFEPGDPEHFMDQYVDWHLEIISKEPIDLLANVSWLPKELAGGYEQLWTEARVGKVVEAALKYEVAMEISASFELPKLSFLRVAKAAGLKFTLGSNGRYPNMGKLEYAIETAKALGLTASDMFTPAPDGQKAVQRRMA